VTLKTRLKALEAVDGKTEEKSGLVFAPLMSVEEFCAVAPIQQTELLAETYRLAMQHGGDAWQH
jgi:hypothetical protein